jgi:phosphoribosylanthranilate isomerase
MLEAAAKVNFFCTRLPENLLYTLTNQGMQYKMGKPDMTLVQIYEIQTPGEAEQMAALGVDHIGSVIQSEEHLRNPDILDTVRAVHQAGLKSSLIPLFDKIDLISVLIDFYKPDIIHFCESLSSDAALLDTIIERQKIIRKRFPQLEIMRSIPIAPTRWANKVPSLEFAKKFEPCSDWFLTDTWLIDSHQGSALDQPVSGFVGITGQTCDWDVAAKLVAASTIPVILAGGIGPQNVQDGISRVNPAGVDSCTLTNAVDGDGRAVRFCKDFGKVGALVTAVREIDRLNNLF